MKNMAKKQGIIFPPEESMTAEDRPKSMSLSYWSNSYTNWNFLMLVLIGKYVIINRGDLMKDDFFDYLVATDQLDDFLGGNKNESEVDSEEEDTENSEEDIDN